MTDRFSRRSKLSGAVRTCVEGLEKRSMLDAVYHDLTAGSLIENWENTSRLSVADNWSAVHSIEGYLMTTPTGTNRDPQTVLADTSAVLDVNVNQTSGNFTTGGVSELQLTTPIAGTGNGTVGMQGSDGSPHAFLKLYLNNSGRSSAVRVKYDLIDVDSTASSSATFQQSFALQYRIGNSGSYVNVPAGYIQNAADFTTGATGLTTNFDVTLPSDTIGAANVEVRILTTNSGGTDQMVAVDNIRVFGNDVFAFDPTAYSFVENAGATSLTVKRIGDLAGSVSVNYTFTSGSATSPGDYLGSSGTLTFGDGVDTQTIPLTIVNDLTAESQEQFTVTLSSPTGGFTLGAGATATVTINDDDVAVPAVVVNEVKVNPVDTDATQEYIEIKGTPNAALGNVYLVNLEGDGAGAGSADIVINLSSATLGSSGLLVVGSPSLAIASGATLVSDVRFDNSGGIIENGTNSVALIFSPTPILDGDDLDTNNDGTLDLPPGATLIDAVGSSDGGATDFAYGAVLVQPNGVFHAATRLPTDLTPLSAGAWYSGDLVSPSLNPAGDTGIYDPRLTGGQNVPQGAVLTPGAENYPTGANAGSFTLIPISASAAEEAGLIEVIVYRAGGAVGAASVTITSTGGTATSGSDYTAINQVLNFADGEYSKTVTIQIADDGDAEGAETIELQLSAATGGATIAREGLGRYTILLSDPQAPVGLLLNELDINPPGTDQPFEFVELRGAASTTLLNVYLISVEGSGNAAGTVDQVINVSGGIIGPNGILIVKANSGGFIPEDAATGIRGNASFDVGGLGIESDSNTVFLIYAPPGSALPTEGIDIDPANGGTLNLDPTLVVLDSIAWLDGDAGDIGYGGAVVGPTPNTSAGDGPDALARLDGDVDAFDPAAWFFGNLVTTGSLQSQTEFNSGQVSANFPSGGRLTPGAANIFSGDTIAPTVDSAAFVAQTPSAVVQYIDVVFSEDVSASLAAADFELVRTSDNLAVPLTIASITGGTTARLTFTTTNTLGSSILLDGNYRVRVKAGEVADVAGNTLAVDSDTTFAFKNADLNGDLTVNFDDLLSLAQNYGGSGKTFAQGDVNYDGVVNFDDLLALAQRYGTGLVQVATAKPTTARRGASVRSDNISVVS